MSSSYLLESMQVSKAKKRRLGRIQKTIGDYCLLAGSPADATDHYSTAIELARLTGDVFWHAGAIEGIVSALVVCFYSAESNTWGIFLRNPSSDHFVHQFDI